MKQVIFTIKKDGFHTGVIDVLEVKPDAQFTLELARVVIASIYERFDVLSCQVSDLTTAGYTAKRRNVTPMSDPMDLQIVYHGQKTALQ